MSSYFSSLTSSTRITNIGSRLNSLRRAITSGEEADDPDNEDSSHISNVLRAYYTEKGRSYPEWLPPDPKAPTPQPRLVATQASFQQGNNGGYGQPMTIQASSRGGGLGDLWGETGPSQPPASQTSSLRSRSGGARTPVAAMNNSLRPTQSQTPPPQSVSRRPLPSQRAGSSQSNLSTQSGPGVLERAPSGGSAQERLRARLQGGSSSSSASPSQTQSQPQNHDSGYGQSYHGSGGGGGGGGGYKRPGGLPSGLRPGHR
ncbi:hypothetical protein UA08_01388 [Talaromyces atroroseus]|uniref:Mso1 N-terminal domain-containing protein n=1 Tax=Talaromyces atroroseus TaxID=1441469 RepID=A0A1Q5Q9P0_TALAT|nr:hypothetical protein UA08_01388 [Talaromyces atroroseus]OKL62643.1 hypothetical protein UA08_01388 [Talaromyces atroroseus]